MSTEAIDALAERLRPHYSRFLGAHPGQVLLTGHSHQAWPDVSREGQLEAWDDAARLIDGKWERVFGEILPELTGHIARRIGTRRASDLALAPNTHELVFRWMSCFAVDAAVVTTDSEFHSLRRQLERAEEAGARVSRVAVEGEAPFSERFLAEVDRLRPDYVALSYVLFTTSRVLVELPQILSALAERRIPVLVDAYHAFNVLELEVDAWPGEVFVTGGGYKYAQHGEGVCWMLLPVSAERFRPLTTGWFSHFESLAHGAGAGRTLAYGTGGFRFFGATFDPTGCYRAVHVLRWMERQGLSPAVLRAQSLRQTAVLIDAAERLRAAGLILRTPRGDDRGGFVALERPDASELSRRLRDEGVHTDVRGEILRLGPAPYVRHGELMHALDLLLRLAGKNSSG